MEMTEADILLDDVRLTLENTKPFYEWCLKWLSGATTSRVIAVMKSHYRLSATLNGNQIEWIIGYFKWRFLTKMDTPVPVMPPKWCAHDHIVKVGVPKTIHGLRANCVVIDDLCDQINQSLKEIPVSKLTFKQQFLLNGTDISSIPNEQIYVLIQQEETRIANLEKIQTKPKRLTAEIEEAKANLAAIVAHLDSK